MWLSGCLFIFITMPPTQKIVVFEDAPSGVKAAKKLGYKAVGVLRLGKRSALDQAGADIVVEDLVDL
jgi:beta-phosphoglucomutase-like phosphatase (HAD superfamily)